MHVLGLDIGTNSVGSAWVDLDRQELTLGVSVFPAGVVERDGKRGAPKNQERRASRSQRRSIRRRAKRKRRLRALLINRGLLPPTSDELVQLMAYSVWPLPRPRPEQLNRTPWHLRRDGLSRELSPYEFGRVLIHLNQRRGALGIETDSEDTDEGKVKDAIDHTREALAGRTFGQMMADLYDERVKQNRPIRNRRDSFEFHADRRLIRDEFAKLWEKQRSFGGRLSRLLTDDLFCELCDPDEDSTWRHKGEIFGQRQTYWDAGTLGRCELEPTDHLCPIADMHAQEYRVIESVNNIRLKARGERDWRPLSEDERTRVINYLRGGWFEPPSSGSKHRAKPKRAVKSPKVKHIREVLGIDKKSLAKLGIPENYYLLNLENDSERELNTDWFYRNVVHDVFGETRWVSMTEDERESVNRAILKFDSTDQADVEALRGGASKWWRLRQEQVDTLITTWQSRPRLEKRLKLSRRAICNLLPYLNRFDNVSNRWPTQIEARKAFAEDEANGATSEQRRRYHVGATALPKGLRHFQRKHPDILPPAPMVANPVVRKAIHEVRRHLNHYVRHFKAKPDRVVIEFARGVNQSAYRRNQQLAANREREKERREIESNLSVWGVRRSNWRMATLRVRLCREQSGNCPFSFDGPHSAQPISERMAAEGHDVEVEHIIPESLTGRTLDFNNVVLCFRRANRNKGQRTPLDWLGPEKLGEVLRRLDKTAVRNNKTKWERLQSATPDAETYRNSQLTDTAYAARQVADYIQMALYSEAPEGERRVFTTKGQYTSRLRADWGLYESEIDREHSLEPREADSDLRNDSELAQSMRRARKDPTKDRVDHRHHALDALVVALTPAYISKLAEAAVCDREYYERMGRHPRRTPMKPPWGTTEEFRHQVVQRLHELTVSHRPEKRRIVGSLHKRTAYGKAKEYPGLFTERVSVLKLKDTQLVEPQYEPRKGIWRIPGKGQGRAVRDPALRQEIEDCLARHGINPRKFSEKDIRSLTDPNDWKLCTRSGIPIRTVRMLLSLSDPIAINGSDGVRRYYVGGNNHHMEILEHDQTSKWKAFFWDMHSVVRRIRPSNGEPSLPMVIGRELDDLRERDRLPSELHRLYEGYHFVVSLAAGEMIHIMDEETGVPEFFVITEVNKARKCVVAVPHWDARRAKGKGVSNPRREIELRVQTLRRLIVHRDRIKVLVDPLGRIRWAND